MTDLNNNGPDILSEDQDNNHEMYEKALIELKQQSKRERVLLTAFMGLTIASMAFAFTVWQGKEEPQLTTDYYYGGTPTAYNISGDTAAPAPGGGCGSGGGSSAGGCCGGGSAGAATATDPKEIETLARLFYTKNFGDDTGLKFNVVDYGCHTQIDVYENNNLIRSLVYRGGQISEY